MEIIEIEDKRPIFGIFCMMIGIITVCINLYAIYDGIFNFSRHSFEGIIIRFAGGFFIFPLLSYFLLSFGYMLINYRNLKINDNSVQYIFKNKIEKELLWTDIKKIRIEKSPIANNGYIAILNKPKYIELYFTLKNGNRNKLKMFVNEVKKRETEYKFQVVIQLPSEYTQTSYNYNLAQIQSQKQSNFESLPQLSPQSPIQTQVLSSTCPNCHSIMRYITHYQKWYCTKCFDTYLRVKICDNCWETNENTTKLSECFFCSRYVCRCK